MKITIVSASDGIGGAARAALRLHCALLNGSHESRMQVADKRTDLASVNGPVAKVAKAWSIVRPSLAAALMRFQNSSNPSPHSPSILSAGISRDLNAANGVINLHWVCNEFLSVAEIGRLLRPTVWTLHDMWSFCGAEHYAADDASARWRKGYLGHNRPADHRGFDLDRWAWNRKRRHWTRPIHIVTPSRWLSACVKSSALMHDWPVAVIPNTLDMRQFQPWPKVVARELLGLPTDAKVILFGAVGGARDVRKGWELLVAALGTLRDQISGVHGVVFGQSRPIDPPALGMPLHWMGHLNDDATLALLYSASDVMVVPSLQENLPQTGTEAQACGCPVVGFDCTGLPDVVEHGETGYLAEPYSIEDLAKGIVWVLQEAARSDRLSASARARALKLWSPDVVVPQYLRVYEAALESAGRAPVQSGSR